MADVVYMLGAGFNCSVLDPRRDREAPLAKNFFQVMLRSGGLKDRLDVVRRSLFVDLLLEEIQRYWRLDLDALAAVSFDIEECLTLFESQLADGQPKEREVALERASFALRNLLLMYLGELSHSGLTPVGRRFGQEVLNNGADVLTFNYDTLAEEAIASSSGMSPKPMPDRTGWFTGDGVLQDDDLDASHLDWRPQLAYGFEFDEVSLPISGPAPVVPGERYYGHQNNSLYSVHRVLKLHGSVDWLKYTANRAIHENFEEGTAWPPPDGLVLADSSGFRMGDSPIRDGWYMEPAVIPPQLYKQFDAEPFPKIWEQALETLSECRALIVVGYSFPPTDFRTRRLFLEAFCNRAALDEVIVVNPDTSVAGVVRRLTGFNGPVLSCDNLASLYGLPASWFPDPATAAGGHA